MPNEFSKYVILPLINGLGQRRAKKLFSDVPIIIGGCARSGTSLLLSVLAAHPSILAIPTETGVFTSWKPVSGPKERGAPAHRPKHLDLIYRQFLGRTIPRTVTRFCEKTPTNVRHIERILGYFQNQVKFIHLLRDGRDVMTSIHPEDPKAYWVQPERWVRDVRAGLAFLASPQLLTIKYEDLVQQHEQTMRRVCDFLTIEYSDTLKSWYEHSDVRANRAWFHPLRQLHSSSIGKWKKEEYRSRVAEIMRDPEVVTLLSELDYPLYQKT
jgi:hypothetical protein